MTELERINSRAVERHTAAARRAVRERDIGAFIRALMGWLYLVAS